MEIAALHEQAEQLRRRRDTVLAFARNHREIAEARDRAAANLTLELVAIEAEIAQREGRPMTL